MLRTFLTASVLALATLATLPAAQAGTPKQLTIATNDLDLNKSADRAELHSRIHAAAVELCGPVQYTAASGSAILEARSDNRACIGRVEERATANVEARRAVAARANAKMLAKN